MFPQTPIIWPAAWQPKPRPGLCPTFTGGCARDDGEAFVLTAYVPGLKAEDLDIQIIEDALSIEGKFSNHEGEYLLSELPAGAFRRTLRLPSTLDAAKAEASIENGLLTLRVPRSEEARPRSIPVVTK